MYNRQKVIIVKGNFVLLFALSLGTPDYIRAYEKERVL